jgi:hypothetical protein
MLVGVNSDNLTAAQLDATIATLAWRRDYCNCLLARCKELGFPESDPFFVSTLKAAVAMEDLLAELHRLYKEVTTPTWAGGRKRWEPKPRSRRARPG